MNVHLNQYQPPAYTNSSSLPCRMIYVYIFLSLTLSRVGLGSLQDKQTDFGLRIISKLSQKHFLGKNIVLSPYGVASTLAMAQLGAAGRTRTALASAMGFSLLGKKCTSKMI